MFSCTNISESDTGVILNISLPEISDLCCVMCEIDFLEAQDSSAKSNFHWQIMKCRLLIHLIPEVIASPVLGTQGFIFIITSKEYFQTGKLARALCNLKLSFAGSRPITSELYKTCLTYTIQCKIAPFWNIVDEYIVQGKEFYNAIEGTEAIKFNILLDGNDIRLQVYAKKVKVPYVNLEDFQLPDIIVANFLADPKGYINLTKYNISDIHILPSMKKGKILSICKEIPERCPFKDYEQIRRHWKNMYGYFLPKNKDGIVYCTVKFKIPKSVIYTYPSICIAKGPLQVVPSRSKEQTIGQFVYDMLMTVPSICGKQLETLNYTPLNTTKQNDPHLITTLDFSDKRVNKQLNAANSDVSTIPSNANLSKIHRLHTTLIENTNTVLKNDTDSVQQGTSATKSEQPKINTTGTLQREQSISSYFKIEKLQKRPNYKEDHVTEDKKPSNLTLKGKLLRAKASGNHNTSLSETVINIEEMAKKNKLGEVKSSILSNWLKKHSIPHNGHGKKEDMINKVLCHLRNTQILKTFRV